MIIIEFALPSYAVHRETLTSSMRCPDLLLLPVMQMFPLPPKPRGVIAPEFLNVLKNEDMNADDTTDDDTTTSEGTPREISSTGRPSRRARKAVDYDESNIDNDGNDTSKKRKQAAKKGANKRGNKSNKKRRSSTSTISSTESTEESDFTVELSGDESESLDNSDDDTSYGSDDDGDKQDTTNRKKSRKLNSLPWNEIPLELQADGLVSRIDRADHERLVNYRKTAEQVRSFFFSCHQIIHASNDIMMMLR